MAFIAKKTKWHGRPMSWGSNEEEDAAHKHKVGGIKSGFSGMYPGRNQHFGSSATGGLPFRDREKWDRVWPEERNRRTRPQSALNPRSSDDIGRQAWEVNWSNTDQQLTMLTPSQLMKFRLLSQEKYGIKNLEASLNRLERTTGLDLDGDGDIGMPNNPQPAAATTPVQRRPKTAPVKEPYKPAYHNPQHWTPSSIDHCTPKAELEKNGRMSKNGIVIGYQGHVPNVIFQHGQTTFGGVHDKARPTDFRLKQAPKVANLHNTRMPGYLGHIPDTRDSLGESIYTGAGKMIHETEHQRLQAVSEQAWPKHNARRAPASKAALGYSGCVRGKTECLGQWREAAAAAEKIGDAHMYSA